MASARLPGLTGHVNAGCPLSSRSRHFYCMSAIFYLAINIKARYTLRETGGYRGQRRSYIRGKRMDNLSQDVRGMGYTPRWIRLGKRFVPVGRGMGMELYSRENISLGFQPFRFCRASGSTTFSLSCLPD